MTGAMVGRYYELGGQPVEIVIQWRTGPTEPAAPVPVLRRTPRPRQNRNQGPKNVLVRHPDGHLEVRPWWRGKRSPVHPATLRPYLVRDDQEAALRAIAGDTPHPTCHGCTWSSFTFTHDVCRRARTTGPIGRRDPACILFKPRSRRP